MKLSIIIPVYNEEKTILNVLSKVKDVNLDGFNIEKEIIIVDDGSTDNTRNILMGIKEKDIRIFFQLKNKGKGAALRTGFRYASGDIILIQDADLEYNPEEYPILLNPIINKRADVVYGSRFMNKHHPKYKLYYLGNIFLTYLTNILYNARITDMETCYKVFRSDIIKNINLRSNRFDIEPEITSKILKNKHKIFEVSISYKCRDFKEGKKIDWKDGVIAMFTLVRYRFTD